MKFLLFGALLCLFISQITTQGYVFQRLIQCENGQFELIVENEAYDRNNGNIEAQIGQRVSKTEKVRCKKWVQSHRVISGTNSHLRKQQYQNNEMTRLDSKQQHQQSALRVLLRETGRQIIGDGQLGVIDPQPQLYEHMRSSISSSSSSKNNDQQFLSLFMTLNMQQNAVIYQ